MPLILHSCLTQVIAEEEEEKVNCTILCTKIVQQQQLMIKMKLVNTITKEGKCWAIPNAIYLPLR